jgi:ribosome-associated protein
VATHTKTATSNNDRGDRGNDGGRAHGIEIAPGVFAPADALRFQFARSGGPGGQNVNKLNTKAELWVSVDRLLGLRPSARERLKHAAGRRLTAAGEIHLANESERGQEANRAAVMQRLREMIVTARVEPKVRRKTKPSRAAKARRLEQKRRRSDVKSMRRRRDSFD